jgi:hypothetical protein
MRIVRKIRNARVDNVLEDSQESEDEWEQWFQDLTDPAKKLWEPLVDFIRELLEKEVRSDGTLYTTSLRVLTTPEDSGPQGDQAEPLTATDAVAAASSLLTEPGSWEQAFRLQISGTVAMEIREGTATTLSDATISLRGIYDGELNPSETIGLTGGTVSLFGGEVTVRLSTLVGASRLQIHSNGNGFLRIAGYTDHADEWNDTDMTDRITIKIPVRLDGQTLIISSDDEFVPGHFYFNEPDNLIADYDDDGYVNAFDISAFLGDFNAADDYADTNGDGIVDQADFDAFMEEYNRSIAWSQFWTNWATE